MKKLLIALLMLITMGAFVGCGGAASSESESAIETELLQTYIFDEEEFSNVTLNIYEKTRDDKGVLRAQNNTFFITEDGVSQLSEIPMIGMGIMIELDAAAIERMKAKYFFFLDVAVEDLTYDEVNAAYTLQSGKTFVSEGRTFDGLTIRIADERVSQVEGKFGECLIRISFKDYGKTTV